MPIFDTGMRLRRWQDFLNIVLEYVENGSLADTVKKFGSLPESLIAVYIEQAIPEIRAESSRQPIPFRTSRP